MVLSRTTTTALLALALTACGGTENVSASGAEASGGTGHNDTPSGAGGHVDQLQEAQTCLMCPEVPGPQGERGESGTDGNDGVNGSSCSVSSTGSSTAEVNCTDGTSATLTASAGETGPQGAIGPQGDVGPMGMQGPVGPTGPQGAQGLKGDTGAEGPKGNAGAQGPKGDVGVQGDKGDTGEQGPPGDYAAYKPYILRLTKPGTQTAVTASCDDTYDVAVGGGCKALSGNTIGWDHWPGEAGVSKGHYSCEFFASVAGNTHSAEVVCLDVNDDHAP
jgi:hypothetical protein